MLTRQNSVSSLKLHRYNEIQYETVIVTFEKIMTTTQSFDKSTKISKFFSDVFSLLKRSVQFRL